MLSETLRLRAILSTIGGELSMADEFIDQDLALRLRGGVLDAKGTLNSLSIMADKAARGEITKLRDTLSKMRVELIRTDEFINRELALRMRALVHKAEKIVDYLITIVDATGESP